MLTLLFLEFKYTDNISYIVYFLTLFYSFFYYLPNLYKKAIFFLF